MWSTNMLVGLLTVSSSSSCGEDSEDEDWSPGDGEDVQELVADAESFMANKKMQRPA